MKQKILANTLGLALIASGVLIPWQSVSAVIFTPPSDSDIPNQATGGIFRGSLFTPPDDQSAPNSRNIGAGASRGSLFTPPDDQSAPNSRNMGAGASRGDFFTPPDDQSAPNSEKVGAGASRGDFFAPPDDQSAPNSENVVAGASRGDFFAPPDDQSAPNNENVVAGASRGDFFAPKSGQLTPQKSASGASREGRRYLNLPNNNIEGPKAILALLPQTYFGTTISERAEILVYLPQSTAREGVFSLKDAQGNTLHQMNVPVSGRTGIISIKVPINLELEKNYQWFLALKIDGELSPRTPYIDGWIKRIQANQEISKSMQQKDLLKQATALGKHGVWYDCVAILAKLRAIQPNNANLDKEWSELLTSVGLEQIEKAQVMAFNDISN